MSQCQYHDYDSLGCPECTKDRNRWEREKIQSGEYRYGAFEWSGANDYHNRPQDAKRTFKSRSAAEKYADPLGLVVRLTRAS